MACTTTSNACPCPVHAATPVRRHFGPSDWFIGSGRPRTHRAPGREDDAKSWQGAVDVGVRACLKKMCRQFALEVADLAVQVGDDVDRRVGGGAERGGHCSGYGQVLVRSAA